MNYTPINTALCSFGMSGWVFHAPFISANPKFNLYGVLERTKNLAQEKYPNVKTFRTLEEMLAHENIELVVVNTPSVTHFEFAEKVIKAGKHIIVEKPFTATVKQAEKLIELAKEKNRMLSVFQNRRYDSDFKTVKKVLDNNLLGEIVDVEIHYDRFNSNLSYKAHKETPTPATGSLYDLGAHLIDQALVLFGFPNAVYASLDNIRPNSKVTDYFDVKLYYNSHRVTLKSSYFVREALPAFIFHGKKGSFLKSRGDVQEADLQSEKNPKTKLWGIEPETEKGLLHTDKDGKIIKEYINSQNGNYMEYYDEIYEAIRNKKFLPVTGTEGMNVIKVIEAAIKSNKEKKVIYL